MINATVEGCNGQQKLKDEEIISYSITFLLAGYETTANTLTYTSYLLALHPEIQQKLQEEIDDYFENNPVSKIFGKSNCTPMYVHYIVLFSMAASLPFVPYDITQSKTCYSTYLFFFDIFL